MKTRLKPVTHKHVIPPERSGLQFMGVMQFILDNSQVALKAHRFLYSTPKGNFDELLRAYRTIEDQLYAVENARPIYQCSDEISAAYSVAKERFDSASASLHEIESGAALSKWQEEATRLRTKLHTAQLQAFSKVSAKRNDLFHLDKLNTQLLGQDQSAAIQGLQIQYNTAMTSVKYYQDNQARLLAEATEKSSLARALLQKIENEMNLAKIHHYAHLDKSLLDGIKHVHECFKAYKLSFDLAVTRNKIDQDEVLIYQQHMSEAKNDMEGLLAQLWSEEPNKTLSNSSVSVGGLFKKIPATEIEEKASASLKP